MKGIKEIFTKKFTIGQNRELIDAQNIEITSEGYIKSRDGYGTFGEMVDVLWKLNKSNKEKDVSITYTITLPLKGIKPIYKKTLKKL